jgi:hypothetical protein
MVKVRRDTIRIEVTAWVVGPLAVHVSAAVQGLTITHVPSGLRIQSRVHRKADALAAIEQLLALPIDWDNDQLTFNDAQKASVLAIVNAVPTRRQRRPSSRPKTVPAGDGHPLSCGV